MIPLRPAPLARGHLADQVFRRLASDLLQGDFAAGAALPSERLLSERFGVSKLLVRQAIHRLAEAGLVDVRQGGATRVRDARDTADLRIIELLYKLTPRGAGAQALSREVVEKEFTQGMSLVEVFARRAPRAQRDALVTSVEDGARAEHSERGLAELAGRFWLAVARGGGNRILEAEVRWYAALEARPRQRPARSLQARYTFYRELAHRLRSGEEPLAYYLRVLTPSLNDVFRTPS